MPKTISGKCKVCLKKSAIYRCPKCSLVYCSLACFKNHKDVCNSAPVIVTSESSANQENSKEVIQPPAGPIQFDEEDEATDLVPLEKLKELITMFNNFICLLDPLKKWSDLGSSEHLRNLLCNKHLRDLLTEVDSASDQSKAVERAMHIPIFTEFVDECLRIVEPPKESLKIAK